MVELVDTLDLEPNSKRVRVQIPLSIISENIAQLVEHWTFNPQVLGSSPSIFTITK